MFYFKKNVRYLKFCEDIKMIQNDEFNARLAIVFCGKERLVHIFDSTPYRDYIPIKIQDNADQSSTECTSINNPTALIDHSKQIKEDVDIKKIFEDISTDNHQLAPQIIIQNNQQYIIFNPQQIQKPAIDPQFEFKISKFDFSIESSIKKIEIQLDLIKPKIKSKLLSVIQTNTIKGIEWFSFQRDTPLLLVVNIDNFICVYKRRMVDNNKQTEINSDLLQTQPFSNFTEDWFIFGSASQNIPIKDYYLKPSGDNVYKLYTIHANNSIYFWLVIFQADSLKITPSFIVSFDTNFIIDNIGVNINETFLYCFNSKGMQIYKLSMVLPFNLVYVYWYDEVANSTIGDKRKGIDRLIPLSLSSFSEEIDEDIIDMNENVTREEVKFFKDLQKPIFSMVENVLFIQLYNAHDNNYSLMYFDTQGLLKIFKDITFFEKCRKGNEKTLMKKFFVSKKNFSFGLSPSLYLKNSKGKLCLNSELSKDDLLKNLHQILMISYENKNEFYSIPAIMDFEPVITPTVLDSFKRSEETEEKEEEYKMIIKWIEKNTLIISSLKFLFTIVKYCNEMETFGMPISYDKIKLLLFNK